MNFPKLINIKASKKYELFLTYSDGTEGYLNLSDVANKGVFKYWEEDDNFFKVYINPVGNGIAWSDDLDICPDAAYLTLKGITFDEWKVQNLPHAPA